MCTCLKLKTKDYYFGRNLDLEYRFGEKVVITPRNYLFDLKNNEKFYTKHAIIGMATVFDKYPLYAEAANEKGLCMAGLYFPGNAVYKEEKNGCINLAPFELIPWLLGNFESISAIRKILDKINITNIKFNDKFPNTQLHWMISDKNESIVLEQMEDGLKIYDNPYEVMTNNPPFNYHLVNINNYMNVSAKMPENQFAKGLKLKGYGQGMGMIGLPGDVTPTSRFVRVVFNKFNSLIIFQSSTSGNLSSNDSKVIFSLFLISNGKYSISTVFEIFPWYFSLPIKIFKKVVFPFPFLPN